MDRRTVLKLLPALPVLSRPALAQGALPVVGFLNPVSPDTYSFLADAFRRGLNKAGFVEGRNVHVEYRWGGGDYRQLPKLAAELVAQNVAVIAATGDIASARAAQEATKTTPIVFTIGGDPVRHGLVSSLNRPGGNTTGVHLFSSIISAKRLELLFEIAPKVRRVALFMNPDNFTAAEEQAQAIALARSVGREAIVFNARTPSELDAALQQAADAQVDSYFTASDPLILDRRATIIAFGQRHRLPGIGFVRQFSAGGSLLSYGPSIIWMYEQCGLYVGTILKGAKVGDLPILQPTDFEFVINLKTATELGISVSRDLLAQTTEFIE